MKCGIYCILNRVTGETYIGKAKDIAKRFGTHLQSLANGTHHAKRMQASFDQHGRGAFSIRTLEECLPAELNRKEHDWMLRLRPSMNGMTPDYIGVSRGGEPA